MPSKEFIYRFLTDLSRNNSKEWMNENRARYQLAKEYWIKEVQLILKRLATHTDEFEKVEPKNTIARINNNLMFHPEKPIYKDRFSCSPTFNKEPFTRIHITIGIRESFIGCGFRNPKKENLAIFRDAIDYNGDEFLEIINSKLFKNFFGGLSEDPHKLKTSPQKYTTDHKHIDILRYKNITARAEFTAEKFLSDSFIDFVEEGYLAMKPFNAYLEKAFMM